MLNENTILEPYTVKENGLISVCCCCFPGHSIFRLFPDLAGAAISHGYCSRHMAHLLKTVRSRPVLKSKNL